MKGLQMDYIKDFINVYKKAGLDTIQVVAKTPIIVVLPFIYSLTYGLIISTAIRTGIAFSRFWGVIVGLIEAMLLSSYFSQMDDGINYSRLSLNSFQDGFFTYLWNIYFMKFVFFIASLLFGSILNVGYVSLASFLLFNAAGESIYLRNVQREDVFLYPLNYLKDNWHIWIPHVIIYLLIVNRNPFFGASLNPLTMYFSPHGFYLNEHTILLLFMGIYFVFRGVLFKGTYNSTIRKRKYMGWD